VDGPVAADGLAAVVADSVDSAVVVEAEVVRVEGGESIVNSE
jgi:hypothetical protein